MIEDEVTGETTDLIVGADTELIITSINFIIQFLYVFYSLSHFF